MRMTFFVGRREYWYSGKQNKTHTPLTPCQLYTQRIMLTQFGLKVGRISLWTLPLVCGTLEVHLLLASSHFWTNHSTNKKFEEEYRVCLVCLPITVLSRWARKPNTKQLTCLIIEQGRLDTCAEQDYTCRVGEPDWPTRLDKAKLAQASKSTKARP